MRKFITEGEGLPQWSSPIIDLNDVTEVNYLYADIFPAGRRQARTIYQAAALPFGGRVKVMDVAIKEHTDWDCWQFV